MTILENIHNQPADVKQEIMYIMKNRPDLYLQIINGTLEYTQEDINRLEFEYAEKAKEVL